MTYDVASIDIAPVTLGTIPNPSTMPLENGAWNLDELPPMVSYYDGELWTIAGSSYCNGQLFKTVGAREQSRSDFQRCTSDERSVTDQLIDALDSSFKKPELLFSRLLRRSSRPRFAAGLE